MLESSCVGWARLTVVVGFVFGGWGVSQGLVEAPVVEPIDPFEHGILDVVDVPPGPGGDGSLRS